MWVPFEGVDGFGEVSLYRSAFVWWYHFALKIDGISTLDCVVV